MNLDDREALALTLSLEVARQWEEQMDVWRERVQRALHKGALVVAAAVPPATSDRGKGIVDEDSTVQRSPEATALTDAEVAKLVRERDEALQSANVHAAKCRKAHILVFKEKSRWSVYVSG